jgi:uncharacterized protein YPO0396
MTLDINAKNAEIEQLVATPEDIAMRKAQLVSKAHAEAVDELGKSDDYVEREVSEEDVETMEAENQAIWQFWICSRDGKKARRVRKQLADNAPGGSGKAIRETPIRIKPRMIKNRMLAVNARGEPVLMVNLKSGQLSFAESAL